MAELKTAEGLINHAISKLGSFYAYGAKGEIITTEKVWSWRRESPHVYTDVYTNRVLAHRGEWATDCSGLISSYTGVIRGSSNYEQTGTNKKQPSQLTDKDYGWAVWKQGHIGIVRSCTRVVEAKGIDYGTIESKLSNTKWVKAFQIKDIDYSAKEGLQGWVESRKGWVYFQNGDLVKNSWIRTNDRWYVVDGAGVMIHDDWFYENGRWYYLAGDGGMISSQWLYYKDKWYYFDGTGACLTGTWYKYNGEWYYLDDTGAMHKGMLYDNGSWYYLGDDGKLITDTSIRFDAGNDGALKFAGLINKFDE